MNCAVFKYFTEFRARLSVYLSRAEWESGTPPPWLDACVLCLFNCIMACGCSVVRWPWVNFQCRGVLLIWMIVGQGPIALAVGAGGVIWTFFSPLSLLFSFSLSLGDGPI